MARRRIVVAAGVGLGVAGATSGCLQAAKRLAASRQGAPESSPITAADGTPSQLCEFPVRPQLIPPILDPAFAPNWSGVADLDPLPDERLVVGLAREGVARAYPLSLLQSHEVVNDWLVEPIIVTYCPICESGITAVRRVNGEPTQFSASGLLWTPPSAPANRTIQRGKVYSAVGGGPRVDRNLVMFDYLSGSLWSQLLAQAICGSQTGTRLELVPSTVARWGDWRARHPHTQVLLPPPLSQTPVP